MKRESAERAKVQIRLKQLQAVLAEQREKVASLQDYRDQAKHYTAEIHRLEVCAGNVQINQVHESYCMTHIAVSFVSTRFKTFKR